MVATAETFGLLRTIYLEGLAKAKIEIMIKT
jgi:hypothetical protein